MFKSFKLETSKQQSQTSSPHAQLLCKFNLSPPLFALFNNLAHKHFKSHHQLPSQKIRELCQLELQRFAELKKQDARLADLYFDNELTISIIRTQSTLFLDMKQEQQNISHTSAASKKLKEGQIVHKYSINPRRLDILVSQIDKNEAEIKKFMDQEVKNQDDLDFASCIHFFASQANHLKKFGSDKLIASRMRLIQTLLFFLRSSLKIVSPEKVQPTKGQEPNFEGSIIYDIGASFLSQLNNEGESINEVNNWESYSSKCLEDKFIQLSAICEQITQLEVFNRTLQFSQLDNGQKIPFLKIVQVLISLHHRVSYLSRKKPHLLKELQTAQQHIHFINTRIQEFIAKVQSHRQDPILAIDFVGVHDQWKSQLTGDFVNLQAHVHRLSEIIVNQDIFHSEIVQRNQRLFRIVELFSKILAGSQEFVEDWLGIIDNLCQQSDESFSTNEKRLILLLDECLALYQPHHSNFRTRQNLSNRTNDQLTYEVNKLIEDYQRLQKENINLATNLQLEHRLKQQLLAEVDEREKLINSLSARNLNLQNWLVNKDEGQLREDQIKEEDLTQLQREVQQCREHNLLFREKLLASEKEREKLEQLLEAEQAECIKYKQSADKLKNAKEQVQNQNKQLKHQIDSLKSQNIRHVNRLNDLITDLANQKSFTERQLQITKNNYSRLSQRLQKAERKVDQYNRILLNRLDKNDDPLVMSLEREMLRVRKQLEGSQLQIKELDTQNQVLKEEIAVLKFKTQQSQIFIAQEPEDQQTLTILTNKLKSARKKNQLLSQSLDKAQTQAHYLKEQLKQSKKTIEQLQENKQIIQNKRKQLQKRLDTASKRQQNLLQSLQKTKSQSGKEITHFKDQNSKKQLELLQKITAINTLQLKIRMLQNQLHQTNQKSSQTTQELAETKIKQYQTTIETHKLIQVKMEEQTRSLKQTLQEKIENQYRLSIQIDRLGKEIDRLKATLEKYVRELAEKQIVIKMQRQKNDEQIRQLREFEIKEKVRKQQSATPQVSKNSRILGSPISYNGFDHNDYDEAKYLRLSKEFQKYKLDNNKIIAALKISLEQAQKDQQFLAVKLSEYEGLKSQPKDSNARQLTELQQAKKLLSIVRQQLKACQTTEKKFTNQISSLKAQLSGVRQRLSDQSVNFNILAQEKKRLQDRLTSLNQDQNSIDKENLLAKIGKLEATVKQLETKNAQLKKQKLEHQKEMRIEFENMYNHYETEMKRVIAETNRRRQQLQANIQQLLLKLRQNENSSSARKKQTQLQQGVGMLQRQNQNAAQNLQDSRALEACKQYPLQLHSKISGEYMIQSSILSNLLQYTFRILLYFSEINSDSQQAQIIKRQLEILFKKHQGVDFFKAMEEYTIQNLKNSGVNEYKKDLKRKAQELELLRQKLRDLVSRQIQQKEQIVNRGPLGQGAHKTGYYHRSVGHSLGQNAVLPS